MIHDTAEVLNQGALMMGLALSKTQMEQFSLYLALLTQESQRVNVTAIREEREIVIKHFLDSLSCVMAVRLTRGMRVLDVGSGAGFPGVPLKIYLPEIMLTVMDASQKHIGFLYKLRASIGCDFEILEGRIEEYGQASQCRETYDLVVSRAVAQLAILAEYCLPMVKIGGIFLSMQGIKAKEGLQEAEQAISLLGGEIDGLENVILPDGSKRTLVKVLKVQQTPAKYPRRSGVPERKPIGTQASKLQMG